jgi:dTDP-4-dehydrorhamnose 3,5-epimerase
MRFDQTEIAGVIVIKGDRHREPRGILDVCYSRDEFYEEGLVTDWDRQLMVESPQRGMIRGLHYQVSPNMETKLVRCIEGEIFDVLVDLRPSSDTYGATVHFNVHEEANSMIYVPEGVAHGYQALMPSKVMYLICGPYAPDSARGIVWNDPTLKIPWPVEDAIVSDRDGGWPRFK